MSEMLANQYFMVRNYSLAKDEYERLFFAGNSDDCIIKKLIVCYVVLKEIDKALPLFYDLIKRNPKIILNTKLNEEDCPCPEIIPHILFDDIKYESEDAKILALAILSLYCDINESMQYFSILSDKKGSDIISEIIKILSGIKFENTKTKTE